MTGIRSWLAPGSYRSEGKVLCFTKKAFLVGESRIDRAENAYNRDFCTLRARNFVTSCTTSILEKCESINFCLVTRETQNSCRDPYPYFTEMESGNELHKSRDNADVKRKHSTNPASIARCCLEKYTLKLNKIKSVTVVMSPWWQHKWLVEFISDESGI